MSYLQDMQNMGKEQSSKIERFIESFIQGCKISDYCEVAKLLMSRVEKCTDKFSLVSAVLGTFSDLDEDSNTDEITSCSGEKAPLVQFANYLLTDKEAFDFCLENIVDPLGQWSVLLEILYALEKNLDTHYEFSEQFINCKQTGQYWSIVNYNNEFDDKYLSLFKLYKRKWFDRECHIHQYPELRVSWNLKCAFLLNEIYMDYVEDSTLRSVLLTEIAKFYKTKH